MNLALMKNPEVNAQFMANIPVAPVGQGGGDWRTCLLPVLRRSRIHYGNRHTDRRRVDGALTADNPDSENAIAVRRPVWGCCEGGGT